VNPSKTLLAAIGLCAAACVHSPPEDALRSCARALEAGQLDEAWRWSTPLEHDRFLERYAAPAVRRRRAEELTRAADGLPGAPVGVESGPAGWRVVEAPTAIAAPDDEQQARALVDHFLGAAQSGDFEAVFADLASSWRARYSPERLKADFAAEPAASARLLRIRAALPGKWELTGLGPQLPLGEGRRLKLQREGGALKVVALE
jgi:hypothetical protein